MACLRSAYDLDTVGLQEQFVVMYLNRGNRVLGVYRASTGGVTGTVADAKLILSVAIKLAACGVILSHNHPSGHLHPSNADEELTRKLRDGAKLLDLKVLDHLIVDPELDRYFSFADEGVL
jgi:DNA repair protein RadC